MGARIDYTVRNSSRALFVVHQPRSDLVAFRTAEPPAPPSATVTSSRRLTRPRAGHSAARILQQQFHRVSARCRLAARRALHRRNRQRCHRCSHHHRRRHQRTWAQRKGQRTREHPPWSPLIHRKPRLHQKRLTWTIADLKSAKARLTFAVLPRLRLPSK